MPAFASRVLTYLPIINWKSQGRFGGYSSESLIFLFTSGLPPTKIDGRGRTVNSGCCRVEISHRVLPGVLVSSWNQPEAAKHALESLPAP